MRLYILLTICILAVTLTACGKKAETADIQSKKSMTRAETVTEAVTQISTEETTVTETTAMTSTEETTESTAETTTEETTDEITEETTEHTTVQTTAAAAVQVEEPVKQKPDITIYGEDICLNWEITQVSNRLGKDYRYTDRGDSKTFDYGSYCFYTYPYNDGDYVNKIEIKYDNITTPNGMGRGKTEDELKDAYGDPESSENGTYIYSTAADKYMYFNIEDGAVTSWGLVYSG